MQIIETEIIINAPKQVIWDILIDLNNYHLWNPFTPKVETSFIPDTDIILHVDMNGNKKTMIQKEKFLWIKPGESIAWGITASFPVRTERDQILTEISPVQTKYYTYDKFWGPLVPLVMLLYKAKVQRGFNGIASGLKTYAEEIYSKQ